MTRNKRLLAAVAVLVIGVVVGVVGARIGEESGSGGNLADVADARGLNGVQAENALKTFVPPGDYDEYYLIASGGHSGQMLVVGVPSLRVLKMIPVFTPEPWSGYGYGTTETNSLIAEGSDPSKTEPLTWADTHHPALSETNGEYDGRWVYINDKANGRIAMVDLADFKTKQLLDVPNIGTSHGGVFITPDSEYVHISSYTPIPLNDSGYAPIEEYQDAYRGVSTWLAIDPETGRMDTERSFQIELPPYTQDLADAGKLASAGFGFINSLNTEMATGGILEGKDPLEASAIANDYDFMHIIDWEKAEKVAADASKVQTRNGMRVISLQTAIDEGLMHFVPEPRSPHGVDVSPDGNYIVVSGKLDPVTTTFSIQKIKKAIAEKNYQGTDPYGVPILDFKAVKEGQVEVGAGPLHTQFDDKGNAYTSLFIDSAVAKWTRGPKAGVAKDKAWKLVDTVPVQYNIGHLVTAEGDTVSPDGKYLVALNKWSLDQYQKVGTLFPQNFQLVNLDDEKMKVVANGPIGVGEPHYVQMIKADKIKSLRKYKPGTDPSTFTKSEFATEQGDERIERNGNVVDVYMTAIRSHFTPDIIRVNKGDTVRLHITNTETTEDATHGFAVPSYNINASLDAGEVANIEFEATRTGSFAFYCTEFCSALHLEMQGWLLVAP